MAAYVAQTSGLWLTAGTWATVEVNGFLDSVAANTALTTSLVASTAFTSEGVAPVINGILVKVALRAASPSGTMTVDLYNSTLGAQVAATSTTINVSDIPAGDTAAWGGCGWMFFAFAAPVTLLTATNYQVRAKTSVSSQVNLFSSATSNWCRALPQFSTTGTPTAGDTVIIAAPYTAAATSTPVTVTLDNTAVATISGVRYVCQGGTLSYLTSASVYDKCNGMTWVWGTFQQATVGSPYSGSYTPKMTWANVSASDMGLEIMGGGTWNAGGNPLTYPIATLAADAAASATSLTTNVSTGWKNGDSIAIASTTRTYTDAEKKALTADAVTTALTIAALTSAHGGNASTKVRAHLVNLTRNLSIFGASTTATGYIFIHPGATVAISNIEIYQMGSNTVNKRPLDIQTTTGSCAMTNVVVHDCTTASTDGFYCSGLAWNNVTLTGCVAYNCSNNGFYGVNPTSGTSYTITGCLAIRNLSDGFSWPNDVGGTLTNCIGTSNARYGIYYGESASAVCGAFSGHECYSNANTGISQYLCAGGFTLDSALLWRNNSYGWTYAGSFLLPTIISNTTFFGNNDTGIILNGTSQSMDLTFRGCALDAGVTLTQSRGVYFNTYVVNGVRFENCTFGTGQTHSTADVGFIAGAFNLKFDNCKLNSTTKFSVQANLITGIFYYGISLMNYGQTAGDNRCLFGNGTIQTDTTIYRTASPSQRLTPTLASQKFLSGSKMVRIKSGKSCTVSIYVRKSVVGDGTAYNGNQPRLMVRSNPILGVTGDTLVQAATNSANGSFMQLTGVIGPVSALGVLEFYVDCDGTTGWVNMSDWTAVNA